MTLYVNGNNVTYFDSFGVEYTQKKTKKFISKKNITTDIYRKQTNHSIVCDTLYCINFIDFMLKYNILLHENKIIWKEW